MNIVVICSDTFRYDHLGFLKRQPVLTPNLDRLAAESACFSEFHLCSFPTVVNRIEVFTGRYTFPLIDWGALPMHFPVLGEVFQRHGFVTAFLADNPHLMKEGSGFGRGFDVVKDIPGQTDDIFQPKNAPMIELPCAIEKLEPRIRRLERYRRNAYWYRQRGTNTTETLFREAIRWLENPPKRFFLWIDSFDPHEPWDAPKRYLEPYPWNPDGAEVTWPHNGPAGRYSEAELANMRSLYKAEVSQSDYWIGRLLDSMRARAPGEHGRHFLFGSRLLPGRTRICRQTAPGPSDADLRGARPHPVAHPASGRVGRRHNNPGPVPAAGSVRHGARAGRHQSCSVGPRQFTRPPAAPASEPAVLRGRRMPSAEGDPELPHRLDAGLVARLLARERT
ncbi:MAG TPA: sulfatase-like hydrolase/transferase [Verrucomicrobia bacterium]|nr:sulfatase-like hydrolase/transferase [Verrucomicrobiota bacterium]HOB33252.1 sulfatase-like hydrolase/transferase [Verrucomicrobiota bacterium]